MKNGRGSDIGFGSAPSVCELSKDSCKKCLFYGIEAGMGNNLGCTRKKNKKGKAKNNEVPFTDTNISILVPPSCEILADLSAQDM